MNKIEHGMTASAQKLIIVESAIRHQPKFSVGYR